MKKKKGDDKKDAKGKKMPPFMKKSEKADGGKGEKVAKADMMKGKKKKKGGRSRNMGRA